MNSGLQVWVNTLRSGNYRQGEGYLRRGDNTYCCLGVLCDIESPLGWSDDPIDNESKDVVFGYVNGYHQSTQLLPNAIAEKYGLDPEIQDRLAQWNDATNIGFRGIADLIEQYADRLDQLPAPTLQNIT